MTLEDFVENERIALNLFKTWWLKNQQISPEIFPNEMNYGDWHEHFSTYEYEED